MAKHSLKLLFLRKYRTSKKYYRQLKSNAGKSSTVPVCEPARNGNQYPHTANLVYPPNGRRRTRRETNNAIVDSVDCCLLIYDCISQNKLRTFVFLTIMGIVSTTGIYFHNQRLLQYSYVEVHVESTLDDRHVHLYRHPSLHRIFREDVFSHKHGIRLKRCALPELNPFSSEVKRFITFHSQPPNCVREQRGFDDTIPFSLKNGSVLVMNVEEEESQAGGCCYRPFHRNGDNDYWSSHSCTSLSDKATSVPGEYDYIEILCVSRDTGADFRDGFALVHRKTQVEDRIADYDKLSSPVDLNKRLSVIILGLDATSRMNFIRTMPKSNKYLLEELSAISLKGYTKVAENTLPNVIPLLTGQTLEEFKQLCVGDSKEGHTVHLDDCPFIWKTFADHGYRTSLSEDDVDIGIFNMNWRNAFVKAPTDYYLRPFSLIMERKHSFKDGYCYGPRLSFEKLLENIVSLAEVFDKDSYFQFTWSTKLSHNDLNKMRWGDEPLLRFLLYLNSNGYLNNTALLVIGDHGSRLDQIRSTAQGKLEDRMPVAYFVLPKWFQTKYQRAYENMKINSNRVTSAFDVHKTLHYFMNLDNLLPKFGLKGSAQSPDNDDILVLGNDETVALGQLRGSSLFNELPENRSCFAAGVPLHWCVCHRKIQLAKNLSVAEDAAKFVITHLNTILKNSDSCKTLRLQSVDEVSQWDPREIVDESCDSNDEDYENGTEHKSNGTADVSTSKNRGCTSSDKLILQIAFTASPSEATFETTVIQLGEGWWKVTEDVVRTNSYEGQSDCVEQKLKPYCYCGVDDSIFGDFF